MVRLVLLRHFERDLADASQLSGLLPAGRERAALLAEELPGVQHLIVSPFRRCLESVRHLPGEVVVDAELAEHPPEQSVDQAMARQHAEALGLAVAGWHWGGAPALGETAAQLRRRCRSALRRHLVRLGGAEGLVVLCSHQSTLQQLSALLGCSYAFKEMGDSLRLDVDSFV
jgi:broad specificity phosphatase PhoE